MARPEIRYTREARISGFTVDTIGFAIVETQLKSKLLSLIYSQSQVAYLSVDWLSNNLQLPAVIKQYASD
jgi:hypothetical protein